MSGLLAGGTILVVLVLVAWGKFRLELIALSGLFFLGLTGMVPRSLLLSGFSHPALITIAAVFIMSRAIIDSGLLSGLGLALSHHVRSAHSQILSVALVTAGLSAFMNNVGALGLMLPTGRRMARRLGLQPGSFGMPLAFAAIIGGSMTMVGTAPNLLIANLRGTELGEPFGMFDFLPMGLAMVGMGTLLWIVCRSCGFTPGDGELPVETTGQDSVPPPPASPRWKRFVTLIVVGGAIVTVSAGHLPSAWGFGTAALILVLLDISSAENAYLSLDLPILLFIGGMLGLASTLSHSTGLAHLENWLIPFVVDRPPVAVIATVLFISSALANSTNNAAAAVTMAPIALLIADGIAGVSHDALLMAVAIGAGLSIVLPTHQATLMAKSKAPFDQHSFMRAGLLLTVFCGAVASWIIYLLW